MDNLTSWELILRYRALLQSNVEQHKLGETTTSVYAYTVFLWAVPVAITLDLDLDCSVFHNSEWLQANVFLDVLQGDSKCYVMGLRGKIPMTDMPRFSAT